MCACLCTTYTCTSRCQTPWDEGTLIEMKPCERNTLWGEFYVRRPYILVLTTLPLLDFMQIESVACIKDYGFLEIGFVALVVKKRGEKNVGEEENSLPVFT